MMLVELLGEDDFTRRVKIYGTDVDEEALALARAAVYDERQMGGVPEDFRNQRIHRCWKLVCNELRV